MKDLLRKRMPLKCMPWSTIIFPYSTNQIIVFWRRRCRCHCHRSCLSSLKRTTGTGSFPKRVLAGQFLLGGTTLVSQSPYPIIAYFATSARREYRCYLTFNFSELKISAFSTDLVRSERERVCPRCPIRPETALKKELEHNFFL